MIHDRLPIHKTGSELLGLVSVIHAQMPRGFKKTVGDKIVTHCAEMLDLMALANCTKGAQRAAYIEEILKHHRTATVWLRMALDLKLTAPKRWALATEHLQSVGRQAQGWINKTREKAPAA